MGLLLAAALWGVAMTGTKFAIGGFGPLTLIAVELVAATVALWLVVAVRGYQRPQSWRTVIILGLLEPAAAYLGETLGLAHTSASNGACSAASSRPSWWCWPRYSCANVPSPE